MHPLRSLVVAVAALCGASVATMAVAAPARAQTRVTRDAEVRAVPDGNVIATVQAGTTWRTGAARAGFTMVTLEGWVDASRLAGRRDSFPATIGGVGTLRLRAEPSLNARILGVFEAGAGVRVVERRENWARVRRDGWVLTSALARAAAASSPATPPATQVAAPAAAVAPSAATPAPDGSLRTNAPLTLSRAPGAPATGTLEANTVVEPVARDRGWVRVRVEAWVPESLLVPADTSFVSGVTAADLRLDPEGFRGRTVRWTVQVVALQIADPLRRALVTDEPYLLAMGPAGENAILYLAVPPSLLDEARRITPMSEVMVTARVRNGRSQPTGAAVLDLISLARR